MKNGYEKKSFLLKNEIENIVIQIVENEYSRWVLETTYDKFRESFKSNLHR